MALAYIRPRNNVRIGPTAAEALENDFIAIHATPSEVHTRDYDITDHPVGSTRNIVDHVIAKPVELTLNCVVSNTPIPGSTQQPNQLTDTNFLVNTLYKDNAKLLSETGSFPELSSDLNQVNLAWRKLKEYERSNQLIEVYTTLEVYTNMRIVKITANRTASTGNALHFTLDLKQISLAEAAATDGVSQAILRAALKKAASKGTEESKVSLEDIEAILRGKRSVSEVVQQDVLGLEPPPLTPRQQQEVIQRAYLPSFAP